MSDINFCNTKEQLNHLGEVVTGKVDGSPTGSDIDTSTLPYTGQVRKTLPALEGEYETSIATKQAEAEAAIDEYRLLSKGPYAAGITLESKFEYIIYNGESYFATSPPYTTTSTTPDADGNLFVGGYVNESQAISISETVLEEGVSTYTDIVYKASGGNSAVENMVADLALNPIMYAVGTIIKTGGTTWEYKDSTGSITIDNFRAFNAACVLDFGATGKGITPDNTAFQKALDTKLHVYVPSPDVCYLITDSLVLNGGQKIVGDSKSDGVSRDSDPLRKGIYGDMAVNGTPLFIMGDGSDTTKRLMSFYDLYLYCYNGPVIQSRLCTEFSFYSCTLNSRFYHAIDTQQTYLSSFYNCKIGCSGTVDNDGVTPSYAILALDNSNGILLSNCRITGGSAGGVADIGRSYTFTFDTCVFETTKLGIRAGGNPDTLLSGNVNNLNLKNCQFENAGQCLDIGSFFTVNTVTITGGLYIANKVGEGIPFTDAAIILGRVNGLNCDAMNVYLDDNQYLFRFYYDSAAAGQGSTAHLSNSSIRRVTYQRITDGFEYTTSGFPAPDVLSVLAENIIELSELVGEQHAYTTDTIVCLDGTSTFKITPIKDFGANISRVEIIEASGALDGFLQIGTSLGVSANLNLDLSSLTFSNGYADVTQELVSDRVRASQNMLYRVQSGSASTKFRVRITYNS